MNRKAENCLFLSAVRSSQHSAAGAGLDPATRCPVPRLQEPHPPFHVGQSRSKIEAAVFCGWQRRPPIQKRTIDFTGFLAPPKSDAVASKRWMEHHHKPRGIYSWRLWSWCPSRQKKEKKSLY